MKGIACKGGQYTSVNPRTLHEEIDFGKPSVDSTMIGNGVSSLKI